MKKIFILAGCLSALAACGMQEDRIPMDLNDWTWECNSELTSVICRNDTLNIISPDGNTVWYKEKLSGDYKISYRITVLDEGGEFDRLSDMNCFWGATDPMYPDNLFERAEWRNGVFKNYNTLNLFYCGFGGNENGTTRFRKYHGEYCGIDDSKIKPILKEYTEAPNLIEKGHWYTVEILVKDQETSFTIDGRTIFTAPIEPGECDGHFGLRFWINHVLCTGFQIEKL